MQTKTQSAQAEQKDPRKIKVFKEHPAWEGERKWFMLPAHLLNSLYLGSWYTDDGYPSEKEVAYIRSQYSEPVVLVY